MIAAVGTRLDWTVIAAYFVFILAFGSFFGRYTRSTRDFFFGGQRFSWWLIAASCVATVVGSYSFIKYSTVAFTRGLPATMTYLNDWFVVPWFMFGWLPIIYYARIRSVPEYFERRFNQGTRLIATVFVLLFLLGYIGINFYTLGVALERLLGWDLYTGVLVVAVISAIYVTAGGQTAVIMTDLVQGIILLVAGLVLFGLGLWHLGGLSEFWDNLPRAHRLPFTPPNRPAELPGVGVFFQDGLANSMAFYLMHQGIMLRFLSAKSVRDARKALLAILIVMMPIAILAVANSGWVARAMVNKGLLPADTNARDVFVVVAHTVCRPGVFGFVMAALTAALMSTVDTLINAVSSVFINDVWRRYARPDASDRHHLSAARVCSVVATAVGVALVPVFVASGTIYAAHAQFTAAVTPPMVVATLLGIFWSRYNAPAALATLLGGGLAIAATFVWPGILGVHLAGVPVFSFGMEPEAYKFVRAFFGLLVCLLLGGGVGLLTRPAPGERIDGYVVSTIGSAMRRFKGAAPAHASGTTVVCRIEPGRQLSDNLVSLSHADMQRLGAAAGDLLYVADRRWWLGGLRSLHARAAPSHHQVGVLYVAPASIAAGTLLPRRPVRVEMIL